MEKPVKKFEIGKSYRSYVLTQNSNKRYAPLNATLIARKKHNEYSDIGLFAIGKFKREYTIRKKIYWFSGVKGGEPIEIAIRYNCDDPDVINNEFYGKLYSNEEI